ncbi:pantoate--beta-alanine ligase [Chitinivibrio alkaliphilus]|uniref:Pantothenate synthetase n=1 Tax=Chitinivibrio alkaliphilus ACht1 TaxID=1313304 RepID=U7D970_9BACT|nr:pantoate--beta-alanine ligase [Chitinivibrio alkaliphilus]ERP31642.1 pantoate-beta-alanine ligase [Chitinivibrio alkaliphilus ACht1]
MKVVQCVEELSNYIHKKRSQDARISFVPTMGALHEGHLTLLHAARREGDILVASIFVNPTQFTEAADYETYPTPHEDDIACAENCGVDLLFMPSAQEMYPRDFSSHIACGPITSRLEGACRPGHFDGVTTVVAKLFNLVMPNHAFFGQKDAQQVLVIRKMVRDFNMPVIIRTVPTVRESDGLARSSRNIHLTSKERSEAILLYRALSVVHELFQGGEDRVAMLKNAMEKTLSNARTLRVEYIAFSDEECASYTATVPRGKGALCSLAVRMSESGTRLIDNIVLGAFRV